MGSHTASTKSPGQRWVTIRQQAKIVADATKERVRVAQTEKTIRRSAPYRNPPCHELE